MIIGKNRIVFSSGAAVYAFDGIVGIDSDLNATYGSDGNITLDERELTRDERTELADHMIGLWTRYKTRDRGVVGGNEV